MIRSTIGVISKSNQLTIVLDGLQLYLNAGDVDSYPGSGTTWTDLSNNAYSTTLVNGVGFSSDAGGTLTFDTTKYVDTNQSLASETFTVGAWFKTSTSGIRMILSKETNGGWPWNYRIWLNSGTIIGDIAQPGGVSTSIQSPLSSYSNGSWYQVMFSRNDSDLYLYVNGVQINTTLDTLTGTIQNSQDLWIGRSEFSGGSYQFIGSISEVMVYNRVLNSSEILQNYNATKTRFGL